MAMHFQDVYFIPEHTQIMSKLIYPAPHHPHPLQPPPSHFWKWLYCKRRFPFRVDPFYNRLGVRETKQGVKKNISLLQNGGYFLPNVSSPISIIFMVNTSNRTAVSDHVWGSNTLDVALATSAIYNAINIANLSSSMQNTRWDVCAQQRFRSTYVSAYIWSLSSMYVCKTIFGP